MPAITSSRGRRTWPWGRCMRCPCASICRSEWPAPSSELPVSVIDRDSTARRKSRSGPSRIPRFTSTVGRISRRRNPTFNIQHPASGIRRSKSMFHVGLRCANPTYDHYDHDLRASLPTLSGTSSGLPVCEAGRAVPPAHVQSTPPRPDTRASDRAYRPLTEPMPAGPPA